MIEQSIEIIVSTHKRQYILLVCDCEYNYVMGTSEGYLRGTVSMVIGYFLHFSCRKLQYNCTNVQLELHVRIRTAHFV